MTSRWPVLVLLVFIAVAALVTSRGPFVNEDYEKIAVNQPFFRSGTLLQKMFVEEAGFERLYYRPLNNLVVAGLGRLWRIKDSAGKFRAVGALAFGLAVLAFYAAARRLALPPHWAFGATAFFALHPFNVWQYFQASWVGNSLVIVFGALAFAVWDRALREDRPRLWRVFALGFLMYAACAARDSGGLFVMMFLPLAVFTDAKKRGFACLLLGAAAAGALAYYVQRAFVVSDPSQIFSEGRLWRSAANSGAVALQYVGHALAGTNRNYARLLVPFGSWPLTLGLAALAAAVLWSVRRRRTLFLFVWCFIVALLEMVFSLWVGPEMSASRVSLAVSFAFLTGGWALHRAFYGRPVFQKIARACLPILGALLAWYAFQSVSHVRVSLDMDRFYRFHNEPAYNWKTLFTWARVNYDRQNWDEAIRAYSKSLEFSDRAVIYSNLGLALWRRGDLEDAARQFQIALDRESNAAFHYNLAAVLEKSGSVDTAVLHYFRTVEIDPRHTKALEGIERTFVRREGEAPPFDPEEFFEGLRKSAVFYNNIGILYAQNGKLDQAVRYFERSFAIDPHYAKSLNNLGMARVAQGRFDEAGDLFLKAVEEDPSSVRAHLNLGISLARQGKMEEASVHFKTALRLDPKSAEAARYLKAAQAGPQQS